MKGAVIMLDRPTILLLVTLLYSTNISAQLTNSRLINDMFDHGETAIAVSPLNANHLLAAWKDDASSSTRPGYTFSTNGGNTWGSASVIQGRSGVDPSVAFDRYDNAFYGYLWGGQVHVSRSTNFGIEWLTPPGMGSASDKPFIAVDNTTLSTGGNVYVSWTEVPTGAPKRVKFSRSTDHGSSFQPSVDLASLTNVAFVVSMPVVGPDGFVYVVWAQGSSTNSSFKMRKSTDGGQSFGTESTVISFIYGFKAIGNLNSNQIPSLAVDPVTGHLHLVFAERASESIDNHRVKYLRSTDGGSSWTTPITIADFGTGMQFFPWVSLDSSGRVSVAFTHSADLITVDAYTIESFDRGVSFTSSIRVSEVSSTPLDPKFHPRYDYMGGFAQNNGRANIVWTDFRHGTAQVYYSPANASPAVPQNLQMSIHHVGSARYPKLTWTANAEGDMRVYRIYRRLSSEPPGLFIKLDSVFHPTATYIDYSVQVGSLDTAFYKITAADLANNASGFSNTVWIQTNATSSPPPSREVTLEFNRIPENFVLERNYPNPFNPATVIKYALPFDARLTIKLYDMLGQEVSTVVDRQEEAGWHEVEVDAADLPSGIYFYRLEAGRFIETKKMILLK